jgi:dTDP-4-amino-4,6-dideoxygalactose transaminase
MIPLFKVFMNTNTNKNLEKTLNSGMITQSKKVEEFEHKLQQTFNHPYILTLNSATSGLTLGLRLLNLQPGDEVLCTPLTCFATTTAVLANRLNIRWVDTDPNTCNMDLDDLKTKITPNTKAILFVHWGGSPINMTKLKHIAGSIPIVEDCAHSFGAKYSNQFVGTTGNIAVFSLQAIKHLTCGDGGLIFLPNQELYERAKLLRWHGISREQTCGKGKDFRLENDIKEWGYKFHMNDINATIGLSNLNGALENVKKHHNNAQYYKQHLQNLQGLQLLQEVKDSYSANWIFSLKVKQKDKFMEYMTQNGVMVSQVHKRNDTNSCVKQFASVLPQLESLEKQLVCIPCGWWLTQSDLDTIIQLIHTFCNGYYITQLKPTMFTEYVQLLSSLSPQSYSNISSQQHESEWDYKNIYGIIQNNTLVATAKLAIEDKIYRKLGHIEDVVVNPQYRQQGFGTKIVKYVTQIAKQQQCYKIVLNCKNGLQNFYENCGLTCSGLSFELRF